MTMTELTAIVAAKFMLPSDVVLEVYEYSGATHPDAANLLSALKAEGCLTFSGQIAPDRKIASIKKLRELVSRGGANQNGVDCSLKQAKDAIEDYPRFLSFVFKHGFPPMGTSDKEFSWVKA